MWIYNWHKAAQSSFVHCVSVNYERAIERGREGCCCLTTLEQLRLLAPGYGRAMEWQWNLCSPNVNQWLPGIFEGGGSVILNLTEVVAAVRIKDSKVSAWRTQNLQQLVFQTGFFLRYILEFYNSYEIFACSTDIKAAVELYAPRVDKMIQKTQRQSEDDRFATCGLLTISIFREAVKKNCHNRLKGWKNVCWYIMEINSDKSKILVNSIKPRSLRKYGWMEKCQKQWISSTNWDPHKQ